MKSLKNIAKKYDLDLLILFGSQRSKIKNHLSDIDIAFYRSKYLSPEEEERIFYDIMAYYKREDVDLINIKTHTNVLLRYNIFMKGKSLYEKKKGLFDTMRWQAYFDFEDFKRFYEEKKVLLNLKLKKLSL